MYLFIYLSICMISFIIIIIRKICLQEEKAGSRAFIPSADPAVPQSDTTLRT